MPTSSPFPVSSVARGSLADVSAAARALLPTASPGPQGRRAPSSLRLRCVGKRRAKVNSKVNEGKLLFAPERADSRLERLLVPSPCVS